MIKIYLFSFFFTIYSSYCFASAKDNIISNLKSIENIAYANMRPPLEILSEEKKKEMLNKLKEINFITDKNIAA